MAFFDADILHKALIVCRPLDRAFPQGLPDLPATPARNGDKGFDPPPTGRGAMVGKMLGNGRLP